MKTTELIEALARLEQDGETEVARVARRELAALEAENAKLRAALERIADRGENGSMSYTLAEIARAALDAE